MGVQELISGLRTFSRHLHDHQLRELCFKALSRARIYRRLTLLERSLSVAVPEVSMPASVQVTVLRDRDIDAYRTLRPDQGAVEIRGRLAQGYRCFVVWHAGLIVHAAWASTGRAPIDYLSRDLALDPGELFVFDAFTGASFRGRGASPLRALVLDRHYRDEGYRSVITAVHPENTASFRSLEKVGAKRVGVIGYIGIGPWRWHFCHRRR